MIIMDAEITAKAYEPLFTEYPDVVTVSELCDMLGIGMKKAYKLVRDGTLQAIPCSRKIIVAKVTVINYVLKNAQF